MKNQEELNRDILDLTQTIQKCYPELSKYIDEMPVTIPDEAHPEITIKTLNDYYASLTVLLVDYTMNHGRT